jgi:hypothetical protein
MSAISLSLPQGLEKCNRDKSSRVWHSWIARFVPIGVVLTPDYVEEVAFLEG